VEDRKFQECPGEARILELFRNMSNDCQGDAILALEALARVSPRSPVVVLRLLPGGVLGKSDGDS
jgi:hypothetical protein